MARPKTTRARYRSRRKAEAGRRRLERRFPGAKVEIVSRRDRFGRYNPRGRTFVFRVKLGAKRPGPRQVEAGRKISWLLSVRFEEKYPDLNIIVPAPANFGLTQLVQKAVGQMDAAGQWTMQFLLHPAATYSAEAGPATRDQAATVRSWENKKGKR